MDTGDFRLLDRNVVDVMGQMREKHRFLRGMSVWVGFRQTGVRYERAERFAGETKYPLKKMLKLASDAITGFSYFPLQLATYLGFFTFGLGLLALLVLIILRLSGSAFLSGQALVLIVVLFLGGVQLISFGMLGEYVGRLYDEAKGRPLYIIRKEVEVKKDQEK
jgi:dolichol-phosphate mannosyltransferase